MSYSYDYLGEEFNLPKSRMRFDVVDKKKIGIMCDIIRGFVFGKSTVLIAWHRREGWSIL